MEELVLNATTTEPRVRFSELEGKMEIEGRSIPEDSVFFYEPLLEWLRTYVTAPKPLTEFHLKLEYFNTSSSKIILDMMKALRDLHNSGSNVVIYWYYEEDDDDILQAGEDYMGMLKIPFELVEIEETVR